jgi:phosphatidylglycerol---prolipoprotein diacylglyceryl transferase
MGDSGWLLVGVPFAGSGLVHAIFMGLGIVAGLAAFGFEIRRRGLSDDRLWVVAGMAVALGAFGSRLGTWFQFIDPSQNAPLELWWADGNRSVLAGLVGAWLGVYLGKLVTGYRRSTGDVFAPAVALAMAIGRIGCLLTENPGAPTGGPWGMVLTPEQVVMVGGVAGVGLHPSFVYEIAFQVIAFIWLWRHRDQLPKPGDLFIVYVAAYALFRFLVEFVRGNDQVWLGLSRPQWFLLVMLPLLLWRLTRIFRGSRQALSANRGGDHD